MLGVSKWPSGSSVDGDKFGIALAMTWRNGVKPVCSHRHAHDLPFVVMIIGHGARFWKIISRRYIDARRRQPSCVELRIRCGIWLRVNSGNFSLRWNRARATHIMRRPEMLTDGNFLKNKSDMSSEGGVLKIVTKNEKSCRSSISKCKMPVIPPAWCGGMRDGESCADSQS